MQLHDLKRVLVALALALCAPLVAAQLPPQGLTLIQAEAQVKQHMANGQTAAQIAKDLLNLSDVRILMGQDESVADDLGRLMGLSEMQQNVITNWAMAEKGRALWMVGDQKYKIQTLLTPLEKRLTYTNDAIDQAA